MRWIRCECLAQLHTFPYCHLESFTERYLEGFIGDRTIDSYRTVRNELLEVVIAYCIVTLRLRNDWIKIV